MKEGEEEEEKEVEEEDEKGEVEGVRRKKEGRERR